MVSGNVEYTDDVWRVMAGSVEIARAYHRDYVGTEHLLLALVANPTTRGARVLTQLGVDLTNLRGKLDFIIGRGGEPVFGKVSLTPRGKKVFELAKDESRRFGRGGTPTDTDDLLIGLLREGEGIAVGVLDVLGATLAGAREKVLQLRLADEAVQVASAIESPADHLRQNWLELRGRLDAFAIMADPELSQRLLDKVQAALREVEEGPMSDMLPRENPT